jgi:uncharacterized protein YjbJ (UPF0337 family)
MAAGADEAKRNKSNRSVFSRLTYRIASARRSVDEMEDTMDWNRVEGNWKQLKGKVKEKWADITDDDLARLDGKRETLEGVLQERYGKGKDMVRKDVDEWLKTLH